MCWLWLLYTGSLKQYLLVQQPWFLLSYTHFLESWNPVRSDQCSLLHHLIFLFSVNYLNKTNISRLARLRGMGGRGFNLVMCNLGEAALLLKTGIGKVVLAKRGVHPVNYSIANNSQNLLHQRIPPFPSSITLSTALLVYNVKFPSNCIYYRLCTRQEATYSKNNYHLWYKTK